jgi:hypothetical protein
MKLVIEMDGSRTKTAHFRPQAHHTIKHCPISKTAERAFMFSRVQLVGMSEIILLHYDLT